MSRVRPFQMSRARSRVSTKLPISSVQHVLKELTGRQYTCSSKSDCVKTKKHLAYLELSESLPDLNYGCQSVKITHQTATSAVIPNTPVHKHSNQKTKNLRL